MKVSTRLTDLLAPIQGIANWASGLDAKKRRIAAASAAALLVAAVAIAGFSGNGSTEILPPAEDALAAAAEEAPAAFSILVDGKAIVALGSEEEAASALAGVTEHYRTPGAELIAFDYREEVTIAAASGTVETVPVDEAVSLIVTGTKEPKTYTVSEGDNLWDIAVKNDMTVEELAAANPQADPDHLKIGTILNLYEVKPYLHLTLTERLTASERIEYPISYEETGTLYKGEVKIKVEGVYGQRDVVTETVRENGAVLSSVELGSTVVSEPSPQLMLKGTKSLSTLVGTGSFTSPMGRLEISSPYGSRGGSRHTGVDLRNPIGTPIYVVDDGVVTFASYQGTYGNLVKVSHGNGIETYYAHCSKLLVSVGDVVRKGDQIATVGNTGRSTGPHLHFEVRKNGVPTNPMNYL